MSRVQDDPISIAVISNRLAAITREMGQAMLLTSRSPIFSESRDFVTAIFDGEGRLVAQTSYIPVLLGAIPFAMEAIRERFKKSELCPGDVIVANDPYQGNSHLPDVTIARPVFYKNELAFWAITKGHQADLGGGGVAGYNPNAKSIWEEGLRLPPIKLYKGGDYQKDLWDLILLNVKSRHLVEGDLHCQIGATLMGEEGLIELLERHGKDTVSSAIDSYLLATRKLMESAIIRIPDGLYSGEGCLDNDGIEMDRRPYVRVDIRVKGAELTFDFSRSDPQTRGFVNSPFANTASVCFQALFACIGSSIPINHGSLRPIKVIASQGSIVHCSSPAPTTASTLLTCAAIAEAIWQALAQGIPEDVQAGWGRRCAPMTAGFNPRTRRPFVCTHHNCKGGSGATYGFDGWSHTGPVSNMGGSRATDPEIFELAYPYELLEYELAEDTGGGYDAYARLIARHLGKHIPGNPTVIVENMTGAGGLIAVNYLYNRAEPDGLTLGNWNGALSLQQYLGQKGIQFDAPKFEWVGSPIRPTPICMIAKSTGVTTLKEWPDSKKPVKLGGMAPGTSLSDDSRILKEALGLPIQLVEGYKGGADVKLAIGQGELDGACGLAWETQKATWQKEFEFMSVMLQVGRKPHPEIPKVPLASEFAKTDEARQLIKIGIQDLSTLGHSYTLPPKTRKDRVATLRKAFEDTMRDPEFLAEAEKAKIIINPSPGGELEEIVSGFRKLSPEILTKLKSILLPKQ